MKLYYITVNNDDEAATISNALLEERLAVCTNWFPISCAYRFEGDIKHEQEFALIVKTKSHLREEIEKIISKYISYTNYIGELDVHSVNNAFLKWLETEVNK